jgi:hypothetical protein
VTTMTVSWEVTLSPYQEIVPTLVASIKRATIEAIEARSAGANDEALHSHINRHFAWLAQAFKTGRNRHLYDGSTDGSSVFTPLRTKALRTLRLLPEVKDLLAEAVPIERNLTVKIDDKDEFVVQQGPTRISLLILESINECERSTHDHKAQGIDPDVVFLVSPLAIALSFLTVPDTPGSQAYSLTTLRNYVFDTVGAYPEVEEVKKPKKTSSDQRKTFGIEDIETAYSNIITSTRTRYYSRGNDPLPLRGRTVAGTILREFCALRGYFWLRFKNNEARKAFCGPQSATSDHQYIRSPYLEKIPEIGEIVNEIWGVLLPIRGAETVFRGGLKFSSEGGLVIAVHGGPGSGKTTLSLSFAAYLAALGISTLFVTAEEHQGDLRTRASSICPEAYRRLSFFPSNPKDWLFIERVPANSLEAGSRLRDALKTLESEDAAEADAQGQLGATRVCRKIVVLDGIHDLLSGGQHDTIEQLRSFIADCRNLRALVILTTGEEWAADARIDYLVDLAIHLSNAATAEYSRKPDRRFLITKARFQLCATGTHGFQIAGDKGVRLSPQINYQLERRTIWRTRLPDFDLVKIVTRLETNSADGERRLTANSVNIPRGSNIFINGLGPGGKAALSLKIAMAPLFKEPPLRVSQRNEFNPKAFLDSKNIFAAQENILVVSFLYARDYYEKIFRDLIMLRRKEMPYDYEATTPYMDVIHLYPGYLRPNDLFNRIEWRLREAELDGVPFTSVIVEGIHNVFLQFPELQSYPLFWPQLFSMLRSRPLTTITTHTNMGLSFEDYERPAPDAEGHRDDPRMSYRVDDRRSEPLRHALVQQTDFSFDVTPSGEDRNEFEFRVKSAIDQSIPKNRMVWSRRELIFLARRQASLL